MEIDEEVADDFPSGIRIFEYLRMTHDPVLVQHYQNCLSADCPASLKSFPCVGRHRPPQSFCRKRLVEPMKASLSVGSFL